MNKLKLYLACALAGLASGVHAEWHLDGEIQSGSVLKAGDTMTGSLTMADGTWIGNGASDGRTEFDDGATPIDTDVIKMLGASVRIGNSTPTTAIGLEDLYVESDLEVDGNITAGEFKSVYADRFHATYTNTVTIVNVTQTKLPFDVEAVGDDPDNVFTLATQTITWNGKGMCHVDLYWDVNANNHAYHYVTMYKNGSEEFRFDQEQIGNGNPFPAANGPIFFYNDHATNVWEVYFYINDGANPASSANTPARHWISGYRLPE